MLRSVIRDLQFARHVPWRQLCRRLDLNIRRRLRDTIPRSSRHAPPRPPVIRAGVAPLALFAPRQTSPVSRHASGWRFTFLNKTIEMDTRVDWLVDATGSPGQLWQMNLHYMEYLENVDDADWLQLVDDWIDANPAHSKGAWRDSWNSYALAIRVVCWMQGLPVRTAGRSPSVVEKIESSLAEQMRFLERNVETDIGGNHLIKNVKAFIWAGSYFAGDEGSRWRNLGLAYLSNELRVQILADGMHYERSSSYHAQVFADLLECRHALGCDPFNGSLDETLARMAQVIANMTHPDGGPVLMNDAGLNMAYAPGECLDAFERLFHRRPQQATSFALKDSGYFGYTTPSTFFVADCGRIAPDELPAHGHGDILSFEWSVAGQRIIVDQGVFEYVAGERRRQARSAKSHNTLCFDASDQADFFGAFRCGRRPNVKVTRYEASSLGLVLEGSHDGYCHLPGRPIHVRRFTVEPSRVEIVDRIEGTPPDAWQVGLLLHPEVLVEVSNSQVLLMRGAARIRVEADLKPVIEDAVWWPDMGREFKTQRVTFRGSATKTKLTIALDVMAG